MNSTQSSCLFENLSGNRTYHTQKEDHAGEGEAAGVAQVACRAEPIGEATAPDTDVLCATVCYSHFAHLLVCSALTLVSDEGHVHFQVGTPILK